MAIIGDGRSGVFCENGLEASSKWKSIIYKIRSNKPDVLHPLLLLAVLTSPIVKAQIASKRFTQDIIDTLGARINELVLPIPKDEETRNEIIENVRSVTEYKNATREITRETILSVAPVGGDDEESNFLTMSK